jgi:hypothetical protein
MLTPELNLSQEFPGKSPDDPLVSLWAVLYAQSEYIKTLEIALVNGQRSLAARGKTARKARSELNEAMQRAMERMDSYAGQGEPQ